MCVFLQSVAVLCKYKAAAVDSRQLIEGEGKGKGNRVENRLTKRAEEKEGRQVTGSLINRQFAKVDTCNARIILGHT